MITKVSQLFKLAGYNFNPPEDRKNFLQHSTVERICVVCKQPTHDFYHISTSDVPTDRFTDFNLLTSSDYICSECADIITNDSRRKIGFIIYFNPDTKQCIFYDFSKDRDNQQKKLWARQFLLKPDIGFFTVCYTKVSNKHFLPYAKLNYSNGNLEDYLVTEGSTVYKINVEELNAYYQNRINGKKQPKLNWIPEFIEKLLFFDVNKTKKT